MRIPITVAETCGAVRKQEPVEIGLPLPEGQAAADTAWIVLDENDQPLPSQFKPLAGYADGSLRAAHGVFLLDLDAGQTRRLTVADVASPVQAPALLREEAGAFHQAAGDMGTTFNSRGELTSLRYRGTEMLIVDAGPSLALSVTLGPAGGSLADSDSPPEIVARIKEAGPVRSILNLTGRLLLRDRRGEAELVLDCDYVFHAGREQIHIRPMLLGAVTEATVVSGWSLALHLSNGGRLVYGRAEPLVREDPNHENMSWRGLDEGWVSWRLAGDAALTAWSPDFARHRNGLVRTMVTDAQRQRLAVDLCRVEPIWNYQDVSSPARPITINRGGWRRWGASLAVHAEGVASQELLAAWRAPLRAFPSTEHYRRALAPWLEGVSRPKALWNQVADKCEEFICSESEYAGSIHGGWDGPNAMYLERGVSRGDFGEYLFNEFFRTGESRFRRMGADFAQVYRDVFCFTIPEASDGPKELGGARSRHNEHRVCPIRSYRGAVLLACMYHETGDQRYLDAMRLRADFHMANYPHAAGRLSMSTRDSAYLGWYLQRPELFAKATENTLHSLDGHFDPEHGYYEWYDESRTLPDGRYPPYPIASGYWCMWEFLDKINASPEMTAYNIIGWYGLLKLHRLDEATVAKIKTVCEWFRDRQNDDGSWPYPEETSTTRWGHGCLQDALAVLYAYKLFGDASYLQSAEKSLAFAESCFREHGRIPLLLGLLPHEETEDSLTYYYGLEALAVYQEIIENGRGETQRFGLNG